MRAAGSRLRSERGQPTLRRVRARLLPELLAAACVGLFYVLAWPDLDTLHASVDFNARPFEDFRGAYLPAAEELARTGLPAPGFYYSPAFALLFVALASLGETVATRIWLGVEVLATSAVLLLALWLANLSSGAWRGLWWLFALGSFPLLHNLHWGQASVLLVALVLGSAVAARRGRPLVAGLLLALSIAIKFHPVLFLAVFLVLENWRAALAATLASALLLLALPAGWLGWEGTLEYYRALVEGVRAAEASPRLWAEAANRQDLAAVGERLLALPAGGLAVLGWAVTAANLWLVGLLAARGHPRALRWGFFLAFASLPLAVGPAWPHWFAWLPFCQLVLLAEAAAPELPAGTRRVVRSAAVLSGALASVFLFRFVDDAQGYGHAGLLLLADLAVLFGGYVLLAWERRAAASARA